MKFYHVAILLLGCANNIYMHAQNTETDSGTTNAKTAPLHQVPNKEPTNRPKAPSQSCIECEYGEGYLSFDVPFSYQMISISLRQNGIEIWSSVMDNSQSFVSIPSFLGEYEISCNLDDTRLYVGYIYFE